MTLGVAQATRFPSPLIKPDVRISRIRLSDWLHHEHTVGVGSSVVGTYATTAAGY
jgi:hypothetical protein